MSPREEAAMTAARVALLGRDVGSETCGDCGHPMDVHATCECCDFATCVECRQVKGACE